jgi:2-haloacid dehalogenase
VTAGNRSRWVTFDCFGTLVDWQSGFAEILAPLAGGRHADLLRAYHASERVIEREKPYRRYRDVLATALLRAAAQTGTPVSAPDAQALARSWGSMRVFDDVESMLAELRERGWRLAVLTNCDDDLFEITHRRFARPFDLFLTAERVRAYKPEPWHFRGFERVTHVSRRDWVHVACSWYHDIAPAQALGIQRVWLDRERTGEDPSTASLQVHTAAEVVTAVERLFEGLTIAPGARARPVGA